MRIRRAIGLVFLLGAPLLTVGRMLLRDFHHQLRLKAGWEWLYEHPVALALIPPAMFVAGFVLLFPEMRGSRLLAFLVGLLGCIPVLHLVLVAGLHSGMDHRVVRLEDAGPFQEAVVLTQGNLELDGTIYVRRSAGATMERWGELHYPRCDWPFTVHRSPNGPRYLFVDSNMSAVAVVDLEDRNSVETEEPMDLDALQREFPVRLERLPDPAPLRVMSFNIRYDNPRDGENRWERRRDLVVETIETFDPDLLGLQEVLHHQGEFLRERLEGYGFIGVGRDDGATSGEYAPLMYREKRFERLESGHFWLSETPEVPGSMGWDAACTRMVTWARLRDRQAGGPILVVNTHWDHRGATARLESAKMVKSFVTAQEDPFVITGDFNAAFPSEPHRILKSGMKDTWWNVHRESGEEGGTFHGFRGAASEARIDWILCSKDFRVRSAAIDRTSRDGRYPSDHFPVTAVIE